ncbi:MAG: M23 family metallopeptidase [Zetaproteobacteria bacterium]|nr:M23 family metallopeptidase [Zetaproteobacteria bacterium]
MKGLPLLLTRSEDDIRHVAITPKFQRWGLILIALFFVLIGAAAVSIYQYNHVLQQWHQSQEKQLLLQQRHAQEIDTLNAKIVAEQQAMSVYARELSLMQARVVRLDALGEQLVQVAELDDKEFDFSQEPALGGPRMRVVQPLPALEFDHQVHSLSGHMASLDVQLTVIDHVLQGARGEKEARPQIWPTEGGWISSRFGVRNDPFTGGRAMHQGVDIANRKGAPVFASGAGIVMFAGEMAGYGRMVEVEHGYGYRTRYGHLLHIDVEVGDQIEVNQLVGRIGSSGRSTGPHLHYEVSRFGRNLNPVNYLPRG